jgi:4-amino-4-deoxy-L-arabinose transferase-like glycosyltransferase
MLDVIILACAPLSGAFAIAALELSKRAIPRGLAITILLVVTEFIYFLVWSVFLVILNHVHARFVPLYLVLTILGMVIVKFRLGSSKRLRKD